MVAPNNKMMAIIKATQIHFQITNNWNLIVLQYKTTHMKMNTRKAKIIKIKNAIQPLFMLEKLFSLVLLIIEDRIAFLVFI